MENDELLKRQKRLKHVEEMLDAFGRKLVVLGRVEAGEEVRHRLANTFWYTLFCATISGKNGYRKTDGVSRRMKRTLKMQDLRRRTKRSTSTFACQRFK